MTFDNTEDFDGQIQGDLSLEETSGLLGESPNTKALLHTPGEARELVQELLLFSTDLLSTKHCQDCLRTGYRGELARTYPCSPKQGLGWNMPALDQRSSTF